MLRLVGAVAFFLVLAGCSTAPSPPETTPAPTFVSSASVTPEPIQLTDTLHLLVVPHLTGHEPKSKTDTQVPLAALADTANAPTWALQLPKAVPALTVNVTLWVSVQGVVAHETGATGSSCFWQLFVSVTVAEKGTHAVGDCLEEPAVVPEGIRELHFSALSLSDLPMNATVGIQLATGALVLAPGASMNLLTASVDHDSSFTMAGLHLPVDTLTLLG